jgi:hypothetical protein
MRPRKELAMNLSNRRKVEVELPEFLIRSLHQRVADANRDAAPHEQVDLNEVIEWYLVSPITIADVPQFEAAIPGFSDALSAWLNNVTYDPQ